MPAPIGVVATAGNNGRFGFPGIQLAWETVGLPDTSDSYNIYSSESFGTYNKIGSTVGGLAVFLATGLKSGIGYQFKIRSVVGGVESADSLVVSATTEAVIPSPPSRVNTTVLSTVVTQTTIRVNYDVGRANPPIIPPATDPTGYDGNPVPELAVWMSADGGITFKRWFARRFWTYWYVDNLLPLTTYIFRFAVSGYDTSPVSQVAYTTIARPVGVPIEPTDLIVTPDIDGIHLAWTNPGAASVSIERGQWNGNTYGPGFWSSVGLTLAGATSFVDTTYPQRTGVYYRIRTNTGANYSDYVTPRADLARPPLVSTPAIYRQGITVDVGPGTANPVLTDAILNATGPGDTIQVHWDGVTPILQKLLLSTCGTASNPITLKGIRHANGTRPAINGNGATEVGGQLTTLPTDGANRGIVIVGRKVGDDRGYKPDHWRITGLEVYNGRPGHTYTPVGGGTANYSVACDGIFVKNALNVAIDDCVVHDAPNCIGSGTGPDDTTFGASISVSKCTIYNWGLGNDDGSHGIYAEGPNLLCEYNAFGEPYLSSIGMGCKFRGYGTIQGNRFNGKNKAYDIIDTDQYPNPHILRDPNFNGSTVRGNVFYIGPLHTSSRIGLVGMDVGYCGINTGPHLLYGNTYVNINNLATAAGGVKFIRTDEPYFDFRIVSVVEWGNVVVSINTDGAAIRAVSLVEGNGTIQQGRSAWTAAPLDSGRLGLSVGAGNRLISPTLSFVDLPGGNYRPPVGSAAIDAYVAGPLGSTPINFDPLGAVRVQTGAARDLGAYEYLVTGAPSPIPPSPLPLLPSGSPRVITVRAYPTLNPILKNLFIDKRVALFRGVGLILHADPTLAQTVKTWREFTGDVSDMVPPTPDQCPWIRLSLDVSPMFKSEVRRYEIKLRVRIDIATEGTCLDDILNLWGAIESSMRSGATFESTTVRDYLTNKAFIDADGQSIGRGSGDGRFEQPAISQPRSISVDGRIGDPLPMLVASGLYMMTCFKDD